MEPDVRRRQILDVARTLFASRPYSEVTTSEVAREAGVTRALIHHYFGGVRELYLAVLGGLTAAGAEIPGDIAGLSRQERVARNVDVMLDLVDANRETWLAVAIHGEAIPDPEIRRVLESGREAAVERMIAANDDLVSDTPIARLGLRSLLSMFQSACIQWVDGRATREQVHALITRTFLNLVERTIPELEAQAGRQASR